MKKDIGFKVIGIDHLGIATRNPQNTSDFFAQILQLDLVGKESVTEQKVDVEMYLPEGSMGRLEVLAASDPSSTIARFVEKKGGGIHHLALRVDHIENALKFLKNQGIQLIDESPRLGAEDSRIAFIHPRSTGGLLVELVEQA